MDHHHSKTEDPFDEGVFESSGQDGTASDP